MMDGNGSHTKRTQQQLQRAGGDIEILGTIDDLIRQKMIANGRKAKVLAAESRGMKQSVDASLAE